MKFLNNIIGKIKKYLMEHKNVFKRLKDAEILIKNLDDENYMIKGMLMEKDKKIDVLTKDLVETVNEYNILGEEFEKLKIKKDKASKIICELTKRRNEFLKRVNTPVPDAEITNFPDYKYWLAQSFIVDNFEPFNPKDDKIDMVSSIKGLATVLREAEKLNDLKE